jgi:hypothetical protein
MNDKEAEYREREYPFITGAEREKERKTDTKGSNRCLVELKTLESRC